MRVLRSVTKVCGFWIVISAFLVGSVAIAQDGDQKKEAAKRYYEATQAYNQGKIDEAIQKYLEAVKLDPENVDAYYGLGRAYLDQKKLDEAAEAFRKCLELNPQHEGAKAGLKQIQDVKESNRAAEAKLAFNEGNTAFKTGDYETAIEKYKAALALDSTYAKAWYGIGLCYRRLRKTNEAIEAYRKAIQIDPRYSPAIFALGKLLSDLGRDDEALQVYQDAVEADPSLEKAYYEMGRIHLKNKQYEQALEAFQKAVQIKPDYYLAYTSMGIAYFRLGKYEDAVRALENAISFKPDYYQAYYRLAEVYNAMGKHQEALENAKKCLELRRERFAPAAYEAGKAAAALGMTDEAIKYYKLAARDARWRQVAQYELDRLQGNR